MSTERKRNLRIQKKYIDLTEFLFPYCKASSLFTFWHVHILKQSILFQRGFAWRLTMSVLQFEGWFQNRLRNLCKIFWYNFSVFKIMFSGVTSNFIRRLFYFVFRLHVQLEKLQQWYLISFIGSSILGSRDNCIHPNMKFCGVL